jgi:hypothetical protein
MKNRRRQKNEHLQEDHERSLSRETKTGTTKMRGAGEEIRNI